MPSAGASEEESPGRFDVKDSSFAWHIMAQDEQVLVIVSNLARARQGRMRTGPESALLRRRADY